MINEVLFRVSVKSPWEGEFPPDELRCILKSIEESFNSIIKRKKGKTREEIGLLTKVKPGSSVVEFRSITADGKHTDNGDYALRLIQSTLNDTKEKPTEMLLTPEERVIINNFCEVYEKIGRKYPIVTSIENKTLELDDQWESNAKRLTKSKLEEKNVELWGRLMEGDFRLGKYSCKLVMLNHEVISCKYNHKMEDIIAKHLQPLKRDIVVKGIERKGPGMTPVLDITEIIPQADLFNMDRISAEMENTDRFLGIISNIPETADELTNKMIKTTWGDE